MGRERGAQRGQPLRFARSGTGGSRGRIGEPAGGRKAGECERTEPEGGNGPADDRGGGGPEDQFVPDPARGEERGQDGSQRGDRHEPRLFTTPVVGVGTDCDAFG